MSENQENFHEIEYIFRKMERKPQLKDLYIQKLQELNISQTTALTILGFEVRALQKLLDGSAARIDFNNIISLASFLQIPPIEVFNLYMDLFQENFPSGSDFSPDKVTFIKEHFDVASLKKDGIIDSLTDFPKIEKKLNAMLGLPSILEYQKPRLEVAFSSAKIKPKNESVRGLWIEVANYSFEEIENPNPFDRQRLIEYFPEIRWHSTNVDLGLYNVIKHLYRLGVTVLYQKPFSSLHLRGATFSVYGKPCIVLTDLRGYYPTLWFALVHELFHVLFDWDEICSYKYHLSGTDNDELSVKQKEQEADDFAREYLFSRDKSKRIKPFINDQFFVEEFARNNHVHPSFIYVFAAYDLGPGNKPAWTRARKYDADMSSLFKSLENDWSTPTSEFIKTLKIKLYN